VDTQPLLPSSRRPGLRNVRVARRDPGRQAGQAGPVVRISPDVTLPSRRLSYLARIPEPRSGSFARRWRPSPLWDAASSPVRGTPATADATRTRGEPAPTSPPGQRAHPTGQAQPARLRPLWGAEETHRAGSTSKDAPRTRERLPATTSPNWGSRRPHAGVHALKRTSPPDTMVPLHSIPPRGPKPSTPLKREHPPNHRDGRPHRKQQGHP